MEAKNADMARWAALVATSLLCLGLAGQAGANGMAVMAASGVGALASSIAGFAFSAICGAMLFHLADDPVRGVQIMITCSIANQATMTWAMRRGINWGDLGVYLAGGACGVAAGVWLLLHARRETYTFGLGLFLLAYGGYMLFRKPIVVRRQFVAIDFAAGMLGGVTGGAAGFPGAAVTIWCGMKGWDKARQRAVFQPFILIMQIIALAVISLWHRTNAGVGFDPGNLLFVPISLLGTSLGLVLYGRLSDRQFARAVNILLMVSGVSYVV